MEHRAGGEMSEQLRALLRAGAPARLTLEDGAELVLRDPATIRRMIDLIDRAEGIDLLRESVDQMRRGEVVEAENVLAEMRAQRDNKLPHH